ncbi:molybdopterin-containing oxidoreductase family protein [Desulfospira joergensenii]|uniref:molybdopterin-containing oxidoreductase family protein n=1 Tax=Desulfospira joergensenii TaxID=53329 RepID=UPI0003B4E1CD|nr:molybdopterin-dependent oxidoreductase [Desulfospira joergensenii]
MWRPSVCTKDCPDACGLLVKVEQGKITKVKGDPDHPFTRGFICKKAKFFPDHVHNKDRILTPLKRKGPKGSGQFEPISWDEALDRVTDQIQKVCSDFGAQAILPYHFAGHMGIVQQHAGHAFFHKLGASRMLSTICGPASGEGFKTTLGAGPSTDIESAVDSDFIVIWGSNTLTTNVHAWPFFQKARGKGAPIVVIDPYRNRTAKEADIHLMLKPGTDAALALGVMNILIRESRVDLEFVKNQTLGYEDLVKRAAEYPLEKVSRICGVPAGQIKDFALAYGKAKAPFIRTGWGPGRQLRGAMAMRTIACLPPLVGAFTTKGGGITRSLGGGPSDITRLTRPDLCPTGTRVINMVELGNALTQLSDPPVKLFYNYMSNPAAVAPQSARILQGMAREDLFTVVHELFMTDTALMADIILPSASFLEMMDLYKSYGQNYLRIARPVIPPLGESRANLSIFQSLAARMGYEEEVFGLDEEELIKGFLQDGHPSLEGIDREALWQGKAVRLNIPSNPYAQGFNTPSGKVEFFSRAWQEKGLDPLPCGRVWRDPDGEDKFGLELITPPHHLFLNSAFNEIEGIRELAGKARLLIHPDDARDRRIVQEDPVRMFNDRGECRVHARLTRDTRPGLVVAEGLHWPRFMKGGKGINQLTSQRLTDQGETCAFHCSRVEVETLTASKATC